MTWEEAKEAMAEGYLIHRPFWSGCFGHLDSEDDIIYVFTKTGTLKYYSYSFSDYVILQQKEYNDFEIVEL